jgi:exopolysaccharide biosynthesis polyprenyl glycosylphosphotransferase
MSHARRSSPKQASWRPSSAGWFVVDALLAYGAMRLAFVLSPSFHPQIEGYVTAHVTAQQASVFFSFLEAVSAHIFGLHDPLLPRSRSTLITRCFGATFLALGMVATIIFAVLYQRIGRLILSQVVLYGPVFLYLARVIVWHQLRHRKRRLLLLGAGEIAEAMLALVRGSAQEFEVVAAVDTENDDPRERFCNIETLPPQKRLRADCSDLNIDELITCVGGWMTDEMLNQVMECLSVGVQVRDFSQFVESTFFKVPVEHIRADWFLRAELELGHPIFQAVKRGIDILASLVGLMCLSPLLLVAAAGIMIEEWGSPFYSQFRTGRLSQPFRIWKLRTMRLDAERGGPRWAEKCDSRILRVGRWLRMTRLDEVPQFWNILRGEMSLVGPRPERPEFVEKLGENISFFNQRHLVKPGLTGWAQINYPYGASYEDALNKLKYDLYYVKYASLGLDLQIILRTIGAVMKGAR